MFFYISGHGFGHAARDLQVVNALTGLAPDLRVCVRTSVPRWFLEAGLDRPADIVPGDVDTGLVQPDSLSIDEDASARRAAEFYGTFDARVAAERDLLVAARASLVVGDVPPLAFAAAAAAGIPSVAFSNFTWDWIYDAYPQFEGLAPGVRRLIADANARATLALRLPFHGGFASMLQIEDVPLVGRRARVARDETRQRLGLDSRRPLVLATFGGHGGNIPLQRAATSTRFTLVATDYEVNPGTDAHPNLRIVTSGALSGAGLLYTDLLAACDVVVTKLGYGIVSECIANDVALLYALRGRFAEQDVFIREMPPVVRARQMAVHDLRSGAWEADVEALLHQPAPSSLMAADGAEVVARRLLALLAGNGTAAGAATAGAGQRAAVL